jgi:nitrite transporter NirC
MPIPLTDALDEQGTAAVTKGNDVRRPGWYLLSSMMAGSYIGIALVLLLAVTGPLNAVESPWTKLIQGAVFGIALTLVVFAGAELSTGNMMTMVHGVAKRRSTIVSAITVILFSFVGNLVGAIVFSWIVHMAGIIDIGATAGHPGAGAALLASLIKSKTAESAGTLFFRGVLCNFLVCLGVWSATRTKSDGAKLFLIFWCLLAFVGSGFEHVVANMTTFSLALFSGTPGATVGAFANNLLWVGLGNLVGGGLLVGITYGILGQRAKAKTQVNELTGETEAAVAQ